MLWKDRLWQLFLVIVGAGVLGVCTSSDGVFKDSSSSSGSGLAYADFKPSDLSAVIFCYGTYPASSIV